jgi:hypothetical protein
MCSEVADFCSDVKELKKDDFEETWEELNQEDIESKSQLCICLQIGPVQTLQSLCLLICYFELQVSPKNPQGK